MKDQKCLKSPASTVQPLLTLCRKKWAWWLRLCVRVLLTHLAGFRKSKYKPVWTDQLSHKLNFNSSEDDAYPSSVSWFSLPPLHLVSLCYKHVHITCSWVLHPLGICLTDGQMGHKIELINHPRHQHPEMKICWTDRPSKNQHSFLHAQIHISQCCGSYVMLPIPTSYLKPIY